MGRPTQTGISEATPGNSCPLMYHLDNIWINISYFSHVMFDSSRTSELTCTVSGKKKRIFFSTSKLSPFNPKGLLVPFLQQTLTPGTHKLCFFAMDYSLAFSLPCPKLTWNSLDISKIISCSFVTQIQKSVITRQPAVLKHWALCIVSQL